MKKFILVAILISSFSVFAQQTNNFQLRTEQVPTPKILDDGLLTEKKKPIIVESILLQDTSGAQFLLTPEMLEQFQADAKLPVLRFGDYEIVWQAPKDPRQTTAVVQ